MVKMLPVLAGAINGALAYVAGLIGAFVLLVVFGLKPLFELVLTPSSIPFASKIGFAFYGGHFVPAQFGDGSTVNFALDVADFGILYVLLVVAILGATGYYLGSGEDIRTPREGALSGATLVIGYLPLVAIGTTFFKYQRAPAGTVGQSQTISLEVPLIRAIVMAGIVVPIVLGAIGGAVAVRTAE